MPPLSVLVSDGDPSTAFHDQFSTIIRLESRLRGDHSEDVAGPAHHHWVIKHLTDVARAQGFTSPSSAQATALNVHAQDFVTPPPAQTTTSRRPVHHTPWYENFNLADQGVYDSPGPCYPAVYNSPEPYHPSEPTTESHPLLRSTTPYTAFNPEELAHYRAVIREQLVQSSTQSAGTQPNVSRGRLDYIPNSHQDPSQISTRSRLPTTPPSNFPRVRYRSTPPNRPHRRFNLATSTESLSDLAANTTLRASTEPLTEGKMPPLTAPDHFEPMEIYALEVKVGDYIQSVKNPGPVLNHYSCEVIDHQPIGEHEARPVSPNGGLRIQFVGADGTIRSKVFKGLDKVQVRREVAAKDEEEVVVKEGEEGQ